MANVPVPEPEIDQNIVGCQPEQVEQLVALRLEVAEISMGAIVNLDFRRIAVISSHLLKLVELPGSQISHSREHSCKINGRSASMKRAADREASYLSAVNSRESTAAVNTAVS